MFNEVEEILVTATKRKSSGDGATPITLLKEEGLPVPNVTAFLNDGTFTQGDDTSISFSSTLKMPANTSMAARFNFENSSFHFVEVQFAWPEKWWSLYEMEVDMYVDDLTDTRDSEAYLEASDGRSLFLGGSFSLGSNKITLTPNWNRNGATWIKAQFGGYYASGAAPNRIGFAIQASYRFGGNW